MQVGLGFGKNRFKIKIWPNVRFYMAGGKVMFMRKCTLYLTLSDRYFIQNLFGGVLMDCKDWQLICCYTRQKALDDGVLVDVSDFVSDFGFIVPVAVTATLFNGYILPSAKLVEAGQTSESRMIDLLVILLLKIIARPHTDRITFNVSFDMDAGEGSESRLVQIIAAIGPGDAGEPVLTIMLPEDD